MAITGVNYSSGTSYGSSSSTTKSNQELGKDEFLKLLVTQLKTQDPLSPLEDKDFIAQMAQFTSLEQMKNMNNSVQITQATSFIGKQVTWADNTGAEQTGVVSSIRIVSGEPRVMVGQESIELKRIMSVSDVTPPAYVLPPADPVV